MEQSGFERALIVGAGNGLSASLARLLSREGIQVALAARHAIGLLRCQPHAQFDARLGNNQQCHAPDMRQLEGCFRIHGVKHFFHRRAFRTVLFDHFAQSVRDREQADVQRFLRTGADYPGGYQHVRTAIAFDHTVPGAFRPAIDTQDPHRL